MSEPLKATNSFAIIPAIDELWQTHLYEGYETVQQLGLSSGIKYQPYEYE